MSRPSAKDDPSPVGEESDFTRITRRLLFGPRSATPLPRDREIPGAGASVAREPHRHLRTKITLNLDSDIVDAFKRRAFAEGRAYQLLINDALRDYLEGTRLERLARDVGTILLEDRSFLTELAKRAKQVGVQFSDEEL